MAVTANGTPYVESSDLVANYPGVSLALANHIDDLPQTIVQVLSVTKTDTFTTTSATFVDITGLTVTITPTSATNKILIFSDIQTSDTGNVVSIVLLRNSTAICIGDAAGTRAQASAASRIASSADARTQSLNFLDSPATTSATTYKIQIKTSSPTAYVNRSGQDSDSSAFARTASTITVMEVSA